MDSRRLFSLVMCTALGYPCVLHAQSDKTPTDEASDESGTITFKCFIANPDPGVDFFGHSIAILGDTIAVGAPGDGGSQRGAVHLYDLKGTKKKTIPGTMDGRRFGQSLAMRGDRIAIGAPGTPSTAGAAFLYDISDDSLKEIMPPDHPGTGEFGDSVAWVDDKILVGAPLEDAVYLFDACGIHFLTIRPTFTEKAAFGRSVAGVGHKILVGAPTYQTSVGAAYIFDENGNLHRTLTAPGPHGQDFFGHAIASDGATLLIGASSADHVYLCDDGEWHDLPRLLINRQPISQQGSFGHALAVAGDHIVIGAPNQRMTKRGTVYLVNRATGDFARFPDPAPKPEPADKFGFSVAIHADIHADTVVVGAPNCSDGKGAVYLFEISP